MSHFIIFYSVDGIEFFFPQFFAVLPKGAIKLSVQDFCGDVISFSIERYIAFTFQGHWIDVQFAFMERIVFNI